MGANSFSQQCIAELNAEYPATKKCLERIPESLYKFKPHPRSMEMGYLALLVAEIPQWLMFHLTEGQVDFETYKSFNLSTEKELTKHFNDCFQKAINSFKSATPDKFDGDFILRRGDKILMKSPMKDSITSTLNHWIHHRGQLTVYMRLNEISVPSIYGPSADEGKL